MLIEVITLRYSKKDRQAGLKKKLEDNPFITDEQLATSFHVSVQTIRLDRMELSIPELRERIKHVATDRLTTVRSLTEDDVIGEIIDLTLGETAISMLEIGQDHVFHTRNIARGHHLFAQANSLAVALLDDELALTKKATIHFVKQVKKGDRVVAKAYVTTRHNERNSTIYVTSKVHQEVVFEGEFEMYHVSKTEEKVTE